MVITDVNQITYNGDGVTTAWPFTFPIIDYTDLRLTLINAAGARTDITSDYYVDMVNNTVYYPGYAPGAEPPEANQPPKVQSGEKLEIYRRVPVNQLADLGEKWPFNVIEKGLDKLTMICQDIYSWIGRNIIGLNEDGTKWDAKGRPINNVGEPSSVYDAATKQYVDSAIAGVIAEGNNVITVDNVATLRSTDLAEGMYVSTAGYHDINDNGAGVYYIRGNDGDTDNGGTNIILDNGNVAELILNDVLNVKQFGAYGDYVPNASPDNSHDDTAAFQAAINAGYDVFIPTSNGEKYKITTTLTVANPHCKRIYGEQRGKFESSGGGIYYTNTDADTPMFDDKIEGLRIVNLTFSGNTMEGTFLKAHRDWDGNAYADVDLEVMNCRINSFRRAFNFTGRGLEVINCSIANVRRIAELNWVDAEDIITTHPPQYGQRRIRFEANQIHACYDMGIYVITGHANGLHFVGNIIDNGRFQDSVLYATEEAWNWSVSDNTIIGLENTNCVFDFRAGLKNSVISNNVIMSDPLYWTGSGGTISKFIQVRGCDGLVIDGNSFDYNNNAASLLDLRNSLKNLIINGNCFRNIAGNAIFLTSPTLTTNISITNNIFAFQSNANDHYIIAATSVRTLDNSYVRDNIYDGETGFSNAFIYTVEPIQKAWDVHSIPENTDLDTLEVTGVYATPNNDVTQTLTNCPVTTPFIMYVSSLLNSYTVIQTIYITDKMYVRKKSSGGWSNWYSYTGTIVP